MLGKRSLKFAIGLGLLSLLALWNMPATVFARTVASWCQEQCLLAEEKGSFWVGEAAFYVRERPDSAWVSLGQLRWKTDLAQVYRLALSAQLQLNNGSLQFKNLLFSGAEATITNIRLPAAVIFGRIGHGMPTSGWGGWLQIEHGSLYVQPGSMRTQGQAHWLDARSKILGEEVLGSYKLEWHNSGDTINLRLDTEEGSLYLLGDASLRDQKITFKGSAEVRGNANSTLNSLLESVAQRDPGKPGRFLLVWPK